ncbi:hypothetical protein [Burkholderia vietnamiensis]|uniref:hypothetical protein n=1 Tax=Burkholderia vietnamiensis TaxID=60552 RepID=UPI0018DD30DE|nr:hypothetical protein [Burkholderia vietnamiensis]MBH9645089.1 hypothetical protein [Burkholderia vietnamiensis]
MKITDDMLTEWRKQFEAEFPMPPDCIWTGKGYAQTHHNAWRAQAYAHMWDGFVAARRTTPDPVNGAFVSRADLEAIYAAMNHLGDVLNEMDAVEAEDEAATEPGFIAIRRALGEKE